MHPLLIGLRLSACYCVISRTVQATGQEKGTYVCRPAWLVLNACVGGEQAFLQDYPNWSKSIDQINSAGAGNHGVWKYYKVRAVMKVPCVWGSFFIPPGVG